ncbi:MAG: hypothetical protein U9Q40_05465 [Campylobacterota bacterium]|nr:hypothetical protein [Campylobacterota bacterium]
MFGNLLGKNKKSDSKNDVTQIVARVSKMNLSEMRFYVNNRVTDLAISEDGIVEVLKKLTHIDIESSKRYLQTDDMDSKKKKGFDLVILICKNMHVKAETVELLQEFILVYEELIRAYDTQHKDIYASRLTDAISLAIEGVNRHSELNRKTNVLGS